MKKKKIRALTEVLKNSYPEYAEDELYGFILCSEVYVNGCCIKNPKEKISIDSDLEIISRKYVSRGGNKLEKAVAVFKIDCRGKTALDAGCSTGGFTDCLLKSGIDKVHAVDVGYNQIAYSLRKDDRILLQEKTNIMQLKNIDPAPDFAVADLSFRSIKGAASHICRLTSEKMLIALIKPQFEYNGDDDFDGIIEDPAKQKKILKEVAESLEKEECFVHNAVKAPIKGRKGNQEFFFLIKMGQKSVIEANTLIERLF